MAYTIGSNGTVVVDGITFMGSFPTTATLDEGHVLIVAPTGVSIQEVTHQDQAVDYVSPGDYVVGAFVPTILAVLFSIPWHILGSAIKEMEPFYQLQRSNGALAADSLCLRYRSSINVVSTLSAIRNGHFIVWWSGLLSLVVLFLAPLASEAVFIGFVARDDV